MQTGKRSIRDGNEYNGFFAKQAGKDITVQKEARLQDTIRWMKKVIAGTLDQTARIARHLQGAREKLTCKRIWNFCFSNFQYEKDEERKEQIRTPNRSWADRKKGIDCDCFTVLIGSILTHLGIPFVMRMTRYEGLDFEHIYPVALTEEGEVIIDAVVHKFNYEVPYTEKEDVEMDLQVLSGVKGERFNEFGDKVEFEHDLPVDAADLFLDEDMELEGLEGKAEREAKKKKRKAKRETNKAERKARNAEIKNLPLKERIKKRVAQGFHVINKLNPGAALLRGGILAGMKLNIFKIASHLRFAYWTPEEARKNDMDMSKYDHLQRIREKIDKIYFGAGGQPGSLKKAILSGRGNRNRQVRLDGLGEIIDNVSDTDDLRTILGEELFNEELSGFAGLFGLGEPASIATGAAITAATGVLGTIAGIIKKLGSLFKKGSKAAEMFKVQDNADNEEERKRKFSLKNVVQKIKGKMQDRRERKAGEDGGTAEYADEFSVRTPEGGGSGLERIEPLPEDEFVLDESAYNQRSSTNPDGSGDGSSTDEDGKKEDGWFKKNAKWVIPVGVGVVAGGIGLGVYLSNKKKKAGAKSMNGLEAAPKIKKSKKKKTAGTTARKTTRSKTNKSGVKPRTTKRRTTKKRTTKRKTGSSIKRYEFM
ncbi:MAG: hypothetical protein R2780_01745 [Crocinitomicaceae bacterium]